MAAHTVIRKHRRKTRKGRVKVRKHKRLIREKILEKYSRMPGSSAAEKLEFQTRKFESRTKGLRERMFGKQKEDPIEVGIIDPSLEYGNIDYTRVEPEEPIQVSPVVITKPKTPRVAKPKKNDYSVMLDKNSEVIQNGKKN